MTRGPRDDSLIIALIVFKPFSAPRFASAGPPQPYPCLTDGAERSVADSPPPSTRTPSDDPREPLPITSG